MLLSVVCVGTWYCFLCVDTTLVFLMKSTNRKMKLGYYLVQFYLDKMILFSAINKEVAWVWNVSHFHSYKYRKDFSQVELVVSRSEKCQDIILSCMSIFVYMFACIVPA